MGSFMSSRRSQVVWRWRAPARRRLKPVAAQQARKRQQRSDDSRRDDDGVAAGLGEKVDLDRPWQSPEFRDNGGETPVTEEFSRLDLTAGADDEEAPATDRLIRLYLEEAGTVPLLTAADEVRLAEQLQTAKAL
jgi:Sigma-70 factor, region 1.2